jgi:hypothetical protein
MKTRKLWPGHPGLNVEPPGPIPVTEKRNHPEVWVNGKHYQWAPGDEARVPPEALAVWQAYLRENG